MDSNHRFLVVSQESSPLDHGIGWKVPCGNRTRLSSLEGWHLCRSAKGTCDRIEAEAVGLEPTTVFTAPVFKTGPSSGRVTSNGCGGRIRTCGLVVQSNGFLPAETTPHREEGRAGLEPAQWCLTGTCSAAELPTRINSALRESSPPVQLRWQESNLRLGD